MNIAKSAWLAPMIVSALLLGASIVFAQSQTPPAVTPVAIANAQGGVFVVRGNRVSVCVSGMLYKQNDPPAPHCGPATTLKP